MAEEAWIDATAEGEMLVLRAGGDWRIDAAAALDAKLAALNLPPARAVRLDLGRIATLDTAGAWLLLRLQRALAAGGAAVTIENLAADFGPLMRQVAKGPVAMAPPQRRGRLGDAVAALGESAVEFLATARDHVGFLGLVVLRLVRVARHPRRLRLVALSAHMERAGVAALPIVGLLSFLIGMVTAFQGAQQLRRFGAEIFVIDLLGIGFLREMGVLLTAIIVAGRSGSAFTAEIGAMQVNDEIDALRTLGLDPIELLVLPRLLALVLTLPLLAFYADVMGILGGSFLAWATLGIPLPVIVTELRGALTPLTFWLGIIKAPFFAGTIALVGCREGLSVTRSAESVGRSTTSSVVQSIFLVIVIDAGFSLLFSWLNL
jgi:phospholipid/cholesterol/gamma-HCH transport system permease protein